MYLLFASVPCFVLIVAGALLLRNWVWLIFWEAFAAGLTMAVAHSLDGETDGMASGPIIAFFIAPMILAIFLSFVPAVLRIDSKGDVRLSAKNLAFPLAYAVFVGSAVLWLASQI